MNILMCESCNTHVATYWVDFDRRDTDPFGVCWICMTDARHGARQPFVTVMATPA